MQKHPVSGGRTRLKLLKTLIFQVFGQNVVFMPRIGKIYDFSWVYGHFMLGCDITFNKYWLKCSIQVINSRYNKLKYNNDNYMNFVLAKPKLIVL